MIIAGIGCRKGVSCEQVLAAIDAALAAHGLAPTDLTAFATTEFKRGEAAIFAAGQKLGLPVVVVDTPVATASSSPGDGGAASEASRRGGTATTLTMSRASLAVAGTPSVSEAAALCAAGPGAKLLGPRTIVGPVTCALASGGGCE